MSLPHPRASTTTSAECRRRQGRHDGERGRGVRAAAHPAVPVGERGPARPAAAVRVHAGQPDVQMPDELPVPVGARRGVQRQPVLPHRPGGRPRGARDQQPARPRDAERLRRRHRLLVADHQHAARSAVGTQPGGPRRGPDPHRDLRDAVRARAAGDRRGARPRPRADHGVLQALRRELARELEQRDAAQLRRRRLAVRPSELLLARVSRMRDGGRRAGRHVLVRRPRPRPRFLRRGGGGEG